MKKRDIRYFVRKANDFQPIASIKLEFNYRNTGLYEERKFIKMGYIEVTIEDYRTFNKALQDKSGMYDPSGKLWKKKYPSKVLWD